MKKDRRRDAESGRRKNVRKIRIITKKNIERHN